MPPEGSLKEFEEKSRDICSMNYKDIVKYRDSINKTLHTQNGKSALTDSLLPYYCFLSAYSLSLLKGSTHRIGIGMIVVYC